MRKPIALFLPLLMFLRTAFIYAEDSGLPTGQTVAEASPVADIHVVDPHGRPMSFVPVKIHYRQPKTESDTPQPQPATPEPSPYGYGGYGYKVYGGPHRGNPIEASTDKAGSLRIPLEGYQRGQQVLVTVPAAGNEEDAFVFTPEPATTVPVNITYRPTEDDVTLGLSIRDKITGAVLKDVSGFVDDEEVSFRMVARINDMSRLQRFESKSGNVVIPYFRLGPTISANEKRYAKLQTARGTGDVVTTEYGYGAKYGYGGYLADPVELKQELMLSVLVEAPDHVSERFALPLEKVRAGEEFRLELDRAATVTGRVMIEPGVPLTTTTLAMAQASLKKNEDDEWKPPKQLLVRLHDARVEELSRVSPADDNRPSTLFLELDEEGRFSADRLQASKQWALIVPTGVFSTFRWRNIDIHPGANNLGEVYIGERGGELALRLMDEERQPIRGAQLQLPLEESFRGCVHMPGTQLFSDEHGYIAYDLSQLGNGPEQIVRVTPPWGHEMAWYGQMESRIVFEAKKKLLKSSKYKVNAILHRGHTLTVTLERTPELDALARFYSEPEKGYRDTTRKNSVMPYALSAFAIQGLDSDEEGFVYHQFQQFKKLIRIEKKWIQFKIKNVPPGPMGVSLDGGFIKFVGVQLPIAYSEFQMPNTNHQITMRVNPAKVTLHLDNLPKTEFEYSEKIKYVAMLERETPVSTFLGHEISRTLQGMERSEGRDWQDVEIRMFGSLSDFVGLRKKVGIPSTYFYRPAEFLGVPVGNYRIRVYFDLAAMAMKYPMLVFEKHFEVKPSDRDIQLRTEYQGPIDLQ